MVILCGLLGKGTVPVLLKAWLTVTPIGMLFIQDLVEDSRRTWKVSLPSIALWRKQMVPEQLDFRSDESQLRLFIQSFGFTLLQGGRVYLLTQASKNYSFLDDVWFSFSSFT